MAASAALRARGGVGNRVEAVVRIQEELRRCGVGGRGFQGGGSDVERDRLLARIVEQLKQIKEGIAGRVEVSAGEPAVAPVVVPPRALLPSGSPPGVHAATSDPASIAAEGVGSKPGVPIWLRPSDGSDWLRTDATGRFASMVDVVASLYSPFERGRRVKQLHSLLQTTRHSHWASKRVAKGIGPRGRKIWCGDLTTCLAIVNSSVGDASVRRRGRICNLLRERLGASSEPSAARVNAGAGEVHVTGDVLEVEPIEETSLDIGDVGIADLRARVRRLQRERDEAETRVSAAEAQLAESFASTERREEQWLQLWEENLRLSDQVAQLQEIARLSSADTGRRVHGSGRGQSPPIGHSPVSPIIIL